MTPEIKGVVIGPLLAAFVFGGLVSPLAGAIAFFVTLAFIGLLIVMQFATIAKRRQ